MKHKILIVDDEPTIRKLFHDILTSNGFEVFEAANGQEGIHSVQQKCPDLILMDLRMPKMDGYQAARIIKKEINCEIPIIAVTANAMKGDDEKAMEFGCDGYISKPIDLESFLETIAKFLSNGP
jgi:two-component system cell cycle response regulator DivK